MRKPIPPPAEQYQRAAVEAAASTTAAAAGEKEDETGMTDEQGVVEFSRSDLFGKLENRTKTVVDNWKGGEHQCLIGTHSATIELVCSLVESHAEEVDVIDGPNKETMMDAVGHLLRLLKNIVRYSYGQALPSLLVTLITVATTPQPRLLSPPFTL